MKSLRLIHKWIGLLTGLFLFALCITGAVIELHTPLTRTMVGLHRSLFLGMPGHIIVTITTLLTAVEVITGYLIWGKIAIKSGAKALKWNFPNWRMGLHNGAGVWVGIPLLIMAVTGLMLNFGWHGDFHIIKGLHTGRLISQWLWLAAALLAASLPITGLLITLHKKL